ncbi:MAG: sensor histidine kinase [Rhodoferax sp.]|nr:sensor histidine kinase [Rhodoferax sp.]
MSLFKREQRSLFGEILDWMLTPLLLLWPISLVLTWLVAQGIAGKPFDRALEYNAGALAQLVTANQGRVQFSLPLPARELLRADDADTVFFQVLGPDGEHLGGDRALPPPPDSEKAVIGQVRIRDDEIRGIDVKIAYTWVRAGPSGARPTLVQVAETMDKRSTLATEIVTGVMLPQFVILPVAVLLIWLALVQALKPLHQLEARIRARKPDDLSPIDAQVVPVELAPLVVSVNDLLARLKDSIATQKRFLADAAHQLKTPLAGLRMQADLAQRDGADAQELKQSLRQIGRASVRATHTVNQLLALARAEGSGTAMPQQDCDLAALTMEVVRDCVPRAIDRRIDLGYEGLEPGAEGGTLRGNPTLLKEMVRNLVDNAIHYTPSSPSRPAVITVRVGLEGAERRLVVQVEDTGPGIPPAERELVFQPFYRVLGTEADGSGLGLPIVLEIAQQHQARVELEDAHPGQTPPGARFSVRFGAQTLP